MNRKEILKKIKRALARWGLHFSAFFAKRVPFSAMQAFASILVFIGFRLTIQQKKIAKESLIIAFGREKTPQQIDQIIRDCFYNLGKGLVEILFYMFHPQSVAQKVSFENRHFLDEAFKKKKGVIIVTAHFGNFPLMMLKCAKEGYPTNTIMRPARDVKLEKFLYEKRTEAGLKTVYAIPRKECVSQSLKVLRNQELLFIPMDQNFGSDGGVFVDFFGHLAATAPGAVIFAQRTQAPIVPMFIIRQPNDTHLIIVEPPFELQEQSTDEETIRYNVARITKIIETYIRRYPHEWGWMHRRWKSRPSDGQQDSLNDVSKLVSTS